MFIHKRRGWEIPESLATPEPVARAPRPKLHAPGRRSLLAGSAAAAALALLPADARAQFSSFFGGGAPAVPPKELKPLSASRNARYDAGRPITAEHDATTYNNYYEFSDGKTLYQQAQAVPLDPWSIKITGMVKQPRAIALEDLLKQAKLEERVYRHRCVERWAMTVPWTGFPLADFVRMAEPLGSAKYVVFTTLEDAKHMPGLHKAYYPWPYVDGLTMQEAMNELSFLSVGMYGKTAPPQNGAPIRLTTPWKYGFKQVKAIVQVDFTDKRPVSFWEKLASDEYGFWANINPAVPHPRWSQATESLLGSQEVVPTKIWNGYGEFVASMYDDKKTEKLFA